MITKNKVLIVLTSLLGAIIGKQANASTEITWLETNEQDSQDLTDILIKEKIFSLNSTEKTIKVDESKLLQKIRSELARKLADKKVSYENKEIYEKLLKDLNPGSFGRNNNEDLELHTMDFVKQVN